jgi:hypothetical protein
MNTEIEKILKQSSFNVIPGTWSYLKVGSRPEGSHFLVTQDSDEITVVTKKERESELDVVERNKDDRSLISLNVSVPFYAVGFLAAVSNAIAQAGMNILIISTYSKDYILVKQEQLDKAREALTSIGLQETT